RGRQAVLDAAHAGLARLLRLVADIDLARRILADQHHGKPRHRTLLLSEARDLGRELRPELGRRRLAVDDLRRHETSVRSWSAAASRAPDAVTLSRLARALSPSTSAKADLGRRQRRDRSAMRAALAAPSLGAAVTRTARRAAPPASCRMPSTASRSARGVSLISTIRPSACRL